MVGDVSVADAATIMGNAGAIKVLRRRALRALKEALDDSA